MYISTYLDQIVYNWIPFIFKICHAVCIAIVSRITLECSWMQMSIKTVFKSSKKSWKYKHFKGLMTEHCSWFKCITSYCLTRNKFSHMTGQHVCDLSAHSIYKSVIDAWQMVMWESKCDSHICDKFTIWFHLYCTCMFLPLQLHSFVSS